jgi:hypothetical protein
MLKSLNLVGAIVLMTILPSTGHAVDAKIKAQLLKLDPRTRLEQACDTEAMIRIKADKNAFRPDKVIAYTFKDPVYGPDSIKAPGAVFRSKGEWYHLSFKCLTGPQHVNVRNMTYIIGGKVAKVNWDKYFLYD